jgi:hypothetical protein
VFVNTAEDPFNKKYTDFKVVNEKNYPGWIRKKKY